MKHIAEKLQAGETVTFRPRGKSMDPLVKDNQEVTVVPWDGKAYLAVGTVVLCKVAGRIYLHKIIAVGDRGYLIGNNRGHQNGWTRTIYGYRAT